MRLILERVKIGTALREALLNALIHRDYFNIGNFITIEMRRIANREYQELCNTSGRTATRDLTDLVSREIFEQVGVTGKGTNYTLKTPQRRQTIRRPLWYPILSDEKFSLNQARLRQKTSVRTSDTPPKSLLVLLFRQGNKRIQETLEVNKQEHRSYLLFDLTISCESTIIWWFEWHRHSELRITRKAKYPRDNRREVDKASEQKEM